MCCAEAPAASKWIVCVASPNTKCRNAVYTIILSVKFLSKNASYNLELHNLHLSKTYNLKKNELILYDFGKGSSPLCLPAFKKKKHGFCFGTPMFHGTRFPSFQGVDTCLINIQGGSVPQVPDVQQTRGKPQRFERLEFCWFGFFPLKKKTQGPNKTRNGTFKKEGVFERKCQLEESCKVWQTEK